MFRRHLGTFMLVLAAVLAWHRPAHAQARMACAADRDKLCPDVPLGGGRAVECLMAHQNDLSGGCRQALGVAANKAAPAAADDGIKSECRSDAIKLCRDAIGDKARMKGCMQQHAAQLSDGCKTAIIAHGN